MIGAQWRIEAIVDPGIQPGGPAPAPTPAAAPRPVSEQAPPPPDEAPPEPPFDTPAPDTAEAHPPQEAPPWDLPEQAADPRAAREPVQPVESRLDARAIDAARGAIQPTRTGGRAVDTTAEELRAADAHAHPDDLDADAENLGGAALLERELGAQIIEEIRHQ